MNRVIREAFDQIRADESLIEETKQKLKEQRRALEQMDITEEGILPSGPEKPVKKKKQRMPVFGMAAVAAACLVIGIFLGSRFRIGNIGISQSPSAYISIDVNPSIELCLNEKNTVICADAWNDDGKAILDCIDLQGENCPDAVEHLLSCKEFQPYLTEDCELNITVIGASDAHGKELEQLLKNCIAFRKHNGTLVLADKEVYQEAHDHDMSFGKYLLYKQLHELDHTVTTDDCQDMTIKELKDHICAHDICNDSTHDNDHSTTDTTHHAEEEHHQAAVQATPVPQPVPQAPVQQPCDPVVTTPSCPETPCETPSVTETPCPDSPVSSGGHDSGHESGEHHGDGHH